MRKRIIFLDYDGTIVEEFDSNGLSIPHMIRYISRDMLEFFIEEVSNGSKVILVSGRSVADMQGMLKKSLEEAHVGDLKSKVLLNQIEFIGNHGAEHGTINTVRDMVPERVDSKYFYEEIKSRLAKLNIEMYLWTETEVNAVWTRIKEHGISVHYEDFVDSNESKWIVNAVEKTIQEFVEENNQDQSKIKLRLQSGKGVIDILSAEATKGRAVDIRIKELKSQREFSKALVVAGGNDTSDLSFLEISNKYGGEAYFVGERVKDIGSAKRFNSVIELLKDLHVSEKFF